MATYSTLNRSSAVISRGQCALIQGISISLWLLGLWSSVVEGGVELSTGAVWGYSGWWTLTFLILVFIKYWWQCFVSLLYKCIFLYNICVSRQHFLSFGVPYSLLAVYVQRGIVFIVHIVWRTVLLRCIKSVIQMKFDWLIIQQIFYVQSMFTVYVALCGALQLQVWDITHFEILAPNNVSLSPAPLTDLETLWSPWSSDCTTTLSYAVRNRVHLHQSLQGSHEPFMTSLQKVETCSHKPYVPSVIIYTMDRTTLSGLSGQTLDPGAIFHCIQRQVKKYFPWFLKRQLMGWITTSLYHIFIHFSHWRGCCPLCPVSIRFCYVSKVMLCVCVSGYSQAQW